MVRLGSCGSCGYFYGKYYGSERFWLVECLFSYRVVCILVVEGLSGIPCVSISYVEYFSLVFFRTFSFACYFSDEF